MRNIWIQTDSSLVQLQSMPFPDCGFELARAVGEDHPVGRRKGEQPCVLVRAHCPSVVRTPTWTAIKPSQHVKYFHHLDRLGKPHVQTPNRATLVIVACQWLAGREPVLIRPDHGKSLRAWTLTIFFVRLTPRLTQFPKRRGICKA